VAARRFPPPWSVEEKAVHKSFVESGLRQTKLGKLCSQLHWKEVLLPMKTAAEYRAMAEECFKWARETQDDEVRVGYLQLARVWVDAASKLDTPPPTQTQSAPNAA
jgi:hypothetical protein